MVLFKPCMGKSACRDDGLRCLSCGRSLDEIGRLRQLIDQLSLLAVEYNYENIQDFGSYVRRKLEKSISHKRQEQGDLLKSWPY